MENTPLISVIVPVYKVEPYLRKCVDSVLSQTYQNLEVILVDDGSPDGCPAICDEYAKKDARVRVIHKENGGLSDARNFGLDAMRGELVAFVDSDDWVREGYIENMYQAMQKYGADAAVGGIEYFYESAGVYKQPYKMPAPEGVWKMAEAMERLMVQKEFLPSACAKLYKKSLFQNIRYPKGKKMEDLATAYQLFYECKKIAFTAQNHYIYVQRSGSILHSNRLPVLADSLSILTEMLRFIETKIPQCTDAAIGRSVGLLLQIYHGLPKEMLASEPKVKDLEYWIQKHRRKVIFNKKVKAKIRLACLLSYGGFGVLRFAFQFARANGEVG
jgi:glycosyltransferase involved in cell wall biosynthesis